VTFPLQHLDKLISETLHPTNNALFSLTDESIRIFIEESKEQQDKVRTLFLEGILERPKIKDKQQYVRLNQVMLICLIDKLYSYRQRKDMKKNILNFYNTISCHLEDTLNFIEDFFGNYFDRNLKAPATYIVISIKELSGQLEQLRQTAESYDSCGIMNILANTFNNFCLGKENDATYNELMYQNELMNEMLRIENLSSENSITEVLFYYNYNNDDYIRYLCEKLNALTMPLPTEKAKIAALRFEQKSYNQLPTRLNSYLSAGMPSLKEQINHWIEEEIKFLATEPSSLIPNPSPENGEVYVHVSFKGPEIYLLHKAFIDSGGAPGETYKSLFEKTASHLTNKNQKGFSTESLQKSSDKVDFEARENVKRFLQKMIRNIDSY
jgi:hypothetical protein